jgi:hypothetical protein
MSHFAQIEDGIVTRVIVAKQDYIDTQDGTWVQTSYNTKGGKHYDPVTGEEDSGVALRKNYAGIGDTYDSAKDAFYAPQPFPSWTLDDDTCLWEASVVYPDDGKFYSWDEDTTAWIEKTE